MTPTRLFAASFVLFLAALPLLSFGSMEEIDVLWLAGLALVGIAGVLAPLERYVVPEDGAPE